MSLNPAVVALNTVEPVLAGDPPDAIRIRRLVTRTQNGSALLFGIVEMDPGAHSRWSFEEHDPEELGTRYWGPVDETYFVLRGRVAIEWTGGTLECGPQEALYFAPGHRYTCRSIGDDALLAVYALAPAPF